MVDNNPKIKIVDDDIHVVLSDESAGEGYDYNVKFLSLEGYDICWTKDQAESLKQQILRNQEILQRLESFTEDFGHQSCNEFPNWRWWERLLEVWGHDSPRPIRQS